MFGKNIPIKPIYAARETLRVVSIFRTIQGEGPLAGEPAVFIRLAGCNLRCFFCDTDFEHGTEQTIEDIQKEASKLAGDSIGLVVLTGGEPLAQPVVPLIRALDLSGLIVQVETAGTVWQEALDECVEDLDTVLVCSPKTELVHPKVVEHCKHWKYILRVGEVSPEDGLPVFSTQVKEKRAELFRPDFDDLSQTIWVQPCDEYLGNQLDKRDLVKVHRNMETCLNSALSHGYRISLQLHKILCVE